MDGGGWQATVHRVTKKRAQLSDCVSFPCQKGLPDGSAVKESSCDVGQPASISGLGGALGEENGCPLQCSCLENPMDKGSLEGSQRVRQG